MLDPGKQDTGKLMRIDMFPKTTKFNAMFSHTGDIHAGVSGHVEMVVLFSPKNMTAQSA